MADPVTAAVVVGTTLTVAGKIKANRDQAKAEERNAGFFDEQAEFIEDAGRREEFLFEQQLDETEAAQIGSFAKAGIDLSGSPLLRLQETARLAAIEKGAIKRDVRQRARLARLRGDAARERADDLKDPLNNILTAGGGALTAGAILAR